MPVETLDWASVDRLPSPEAANVLNARVRLLDGLLRGAFMELGYIVGEVQRRMLWREMCPSPGQPYESFNAWLKDAAPYSRSHCYAALKIVDELSKDIPREKLLQIDETNARTLLGVSSAIRQDESIQRAAQTMPGPEFVEHLQAQHANQHVETAKRFSVTLSATDYEAVMEALDQVGELMGLDDRAGELVALCVNFVLERQT
ncbi:MAG: hypothetical protein ACYCOU_00330 [Sulfobacillus sp.]